MKLFPHQEQALEQTKDMNRVAYYLDMGLGKTFVGSEKMKRLGNKFNIVICQKSLIQTWVEHLCLNYGAEFVIYDLTDKEQYQMFFNLKNRDTEGFRFIGIINYDLAFRRPELLKLENLTLMLDESSVIQNESTKRSKFVLKLNAENTILLSGTPTSGKYENLYSQLKLLGWGISKDLYWKQYIETEWFEKEDGFKIKQVVGYKNVDRLKAKLRSHGAIFQKTEEVFDLPEQIFNKITVKATKEYRTFMRRSIITISLNSLAEFKDDSDFHGVDTTPRVELIGDSTLTKRLYSRMLCGQFNRDKLDALQDLIDSTEDRLIIFYNFTEELNAIIKLVEDRPISIINGDTKDLSSYENHDNSITIVQYQAGAMGLNLQKANKIIYFTLPERSELFEQSKKRTHRIGQVNTCFYYFLMVKNSIEEDILLNLEMRRDYNDELFKKMERGTQYE